MLGGRNRGERREPGDDDGFEQGTPATRPAQQPARSTQQGARARGGRASALAAGGRTPVAAAGHAGGGFAVFDDGIPYRDGCPRAAWASI